MSQSKQLEKVVNPDRIIDAANMHSPIALLRLKKELATMRTDEIVRIDCTDSYMPDDISSWCDRMGHTYLGQKSNDDLLSLFILK
ncbi:MAG TPA: sulfurtransferase TusA family protein [Desulfopila sp.]|nr:sulfurtransferase TusA family protein [Desulfopila sp.]